MKDILKVVMYGSVFAVPFVLLIVSSSMFFPFITGKNFAFRILVEVALAAWILLCLYDASYRPRWSWLVPAIAGLVGVMFVANMLGEYAPKSFWSNYERMEGWVTLVHFFFYFLITASVLKSEKLWNWFLNTALAAAVIMSLYALGQIAGTFEISQGTAWRVDGRLGNSSYLGVYMLFHMFIAAWMFLRAKSSTWRLIYGGLFFFFAFILLRTGTRGATLGLFGGSALTFGYLALMAEKGAAIKKWALGSLLVLLVIVGGLWSARSTDFVNNNPVLNRIADISLAEGNIRFKVWGLALEGVKERPILGWGQENFNYVFNKYYDPGLYAAEAWYDRTHNIFLDWLIVGGVVGLAAYLSILLTAVWYAVLAPAWTRWRKKKVDESSFTIPEQALILGLLAAYMFHNLFVFDNLGSWIFYAIVLALVHYRVGEDWPKISRYRVDKSLVSHIIAPVILVLAVTTIYFVNAPGLMAARDIIHAYKEQSPEARIQAFRNALSRGSFARQEITEQFAQISGQIILSGNVSAEEKANITREVEAALLDLIERKPRDARVYVISSSFYRMIGRPNKALAELRMAEELSPRKQNLIEEQGLIYLASDRVQEAVPYYERSYELDRNNKVGQVHLAAVYLLAGEEDKFSSIINETELSNKGEVWHVFVTDPFVVQVVNHIKRYDLLEVIFKGRVALNPKDSEHRVNLAAVYHEQGQVNEARGIIEQAIQDIPAFKKEGEEILEKLGGG